MSRPNALSTTKKLAYAVAAWVSVFVVIMALLLWPDDAEPTASDSADSSTGAVAKVETPAPSSGSTPGSTPGSEATEPTEPTEPLTLPRGRTRVFEGRTMLVAYYGTAGTGALGVLGERSPDASDEVLSKQASRFVAAGVPVQKVYELIVTIADRYPGEDGDYNHDISRAAVQKWIDAAHRNNALLILDIQPGRAHFTDVARRWSWALADPWVGLALDPEWRMHGHDVPGRVIGHVGAAEINHTSAWLASFSARRGLPEKVFMLHQFRSSMIRTPRKIKQRAGLAIVQHVDGFGTQGQKLSTYRAVARPKQFAMGFKLFYDEDIRRMNASDVVKIRPRVRFVSYQ